jgi:aminodeoxyfutalosine deaminase
MIRTIHRAKYVLAEPDLLLQNAAVSVSDPGRISRIEPWLGATADGSGEVIDWGSAVIIPGLVNAHTHLELSRLPRGPEPAHSFTDWLAHLIETRRRWTEQDFLESAREGVRQCIRSGTTLVGDISSSGLSWRALQPERLRKVVFEEVLGLSPDAAPEISARLEVRLDQVVPDPLLTSGISPHSPYSVSPQLYKAVAELARTRDLPLATHVAESRSELLFLESGEGEFLHFLSTLGALPPDWPPPRLSPIALLESVGALNTDVLLIHCNYLDAAGLAAIRNSGGNVVYCPRSAAFFGHEGHPVRSLLDMGVNVALGTDSLASNRSLSMLDEMRFLAGTRKDLKAGEIFRMATLNGAAALRQGGQLGRLRPGYWADLAVLELDESTPARHLMSQILEGAGECVATIVEGNMAWARHLGV